MNSQNHHDALFAQEAAASVSGFERQQWPQLSVIVVSGALCVPGTSSAQPTRLWEAPYVHAHDATASGSAWKDLANDQGQHKSEATRQAIAELRRVSGLTWEQLGHLFGVSRRSVHFWASGQALNTANEKHLSQVLDIIRTANRGDARSTRSALFEVVGGMTAFDLLSAKRFEEARTRLGEGPKRQRPAPTELSPEAKAARAPLPPEELIEAQQDRVHRDPNRARAARTVRNTQRETT